MKINDRVTKDKVMKVENPAGIVEKVTVDYIVVKWDNINGQWHYTHEQAKKLSVLNE